MEDYYERIQNIVVEEFGIDISPTKEQIYRETSKRNIVYRISMPCYGIHHIIKIFTQINKEKAISNELLIYQTLESNNYKITEGMEVPHLLSHGNDYLITDYIDGNNLMDIISDQVYSIKYTDKFWHDLFVRLIKWVFFFVEKTKALQEDIHIRNFIIGGKRGDLLYGMDFEELISEKINENNKFELLLIAYSKLLFSILSSRPGIIEGEYVNYKTQLCVVFLKALLNTWEDFKIDDLKYFAQLFKKTGISILKRREERNIIKSIDVNLLISRLENISKYILSEIYE